MTIDKIALLAGVSKTTVSRVLNNRPDVNPETRKKVLEIIEENKFKANAMAKAMTLKRSKAIGLIIPYDAEYIFSNPYYVEVMEGIYSQIDKRGFDLLICSPHNHKYEDMFIQKRVDGYILISPGADHKYILKSLYEVNAPFVSTSSVVNWDHEIMVVDVDNYKGGYEITKYLIDCGHRNIAYIGKPSITSSVERLQGYRRALSDYGIPYDDEIIRNVSKGSIENAKTEMELLIESNPNISAVFAAGDMLAIGAIQGVKAKGLKVPEDISVAGFDDIAFAKHFDPSLTTMKQPTYQKGVDSVDMLIDFLETGEGRGTSKLLDMELIVRNSTMVRGMKG